MRRISFRLLVALALATAVTVPVDAAAMPKPITGALSKSGYTLIAVSADGKANAVGVRGHRFRLRPPASRVTLHLRGPDGVYAGPVVIRGQGRRAIVGVMAGARLGTVRIGRGYARLARRLGSRWVASGYTVRARNNVPIGARVFGRVRSKPPRTGVPGDPDVDGIPNPLDIDDDGDRIMDNLEKRHVRKAEAMPEFAFEFNLHADLLHTANASAAGLTVKQTEDLLSTATLGFDIVGGGTSELDCSLPQLRTDLILGGLTYCSRGGTGTLFEPGTGRDLGPFPECCDADGDGFGTLIPGTLLKPGAMSEKIAPTPMSEKIGTGDTLIQRVTVGGVERLPFYAAVLQYVPVTVPALDSYDDGPGAKKVVYPVQSGDPGTFENPFPVTARSNGDVVVTFTFWRPQRRSVEGDAGYQSGQTTWTDIGGLVYEVEGGDFGRDCPQAAYSTTDRNLTPVPFPQGEGEDDTGGLRDDHTDATRPANPANTLTMTVNLSACLRARRQEFPQPETWQPGQNKMFTLRTTDRSSYASQTFMFKRQ